VKNIFLIILLLTILSSCASPKVINVIGPNDSSMNCKELSDEITKANKYFNEAQEQKKMDKSHNVGAILFFLPGMGVTFANVEEASKAASDRAKHLSKIKEKKNCN